jgi:secreted trypsin-like serine protease
MDIWGLIIYLLNLLFAFLQAVIRNPMPPMSTTTTTQPGVICPPGFFGQNCEIECGVTFFDQNQKIVGGVNATENSWPAQVFLSACFDGRCGLCGGTLIDPKTVLTASHCVANLSYTYTVYLGLNDNSPIFNKEPLPATVIQIEIPFSSIVMHEDYDSKTLGNDIALYKLPSPVNLTREIQVACLPQQQSTNYPPANQSAWVVGWGTTEEGGQISNLLKNAKINIYDGITFCSNYGIPNWDKQICAGVYEGGIDTCQGDSGGPLYVLDTIGNKTKYITTGVVSFGDGCAKNQTAGVYARISAYLDWIERNRR